jgi:FkbH-like protein
MSQSAELRTHIEGLLENCQWAEAHLRAGDLWQIEKKTAAASYVLSCYERLRPHLSLIGCRISFLRSMTVEPLIPILRSAALVSGIDPIVQVGQFNAYMQEILDSDSSLYSFNPDIVILAVQTRDIIPEIWEAYTDLCQSQVQMAAERAQETFSIAIRTLRERCKANVIVHTLEKPISSNGVLEAQRNTGQVATIDYINSGIRDLCRQHRGVYVLDYEGLIANHGRARWHDEAKWLTMRMPFASDSFLPLAAEWLRFIHPLVGASCKALAIDLDNTLWGGVLGEIGIEGIQVGPDYPGGLYRSLQRAILDLHRRGILLAICSKNDHDEAMRALQEHPGMLLRPEHFASFKINWKDKSQNLREIATELNIGTDAIAFLDDSPVERERVRLEMPDVRVIHLPTRADGFVQALRDCPVFERLVLSNEERELPRLYREQRERLDLVRRTGTLEDFYRSLNQQVTIELVRPDTMVRVAQLTQKTNQFNITNRRYTEQQIEDIASREDWNVYSVRVSDRFGDSGIVGVVITKVDGCSWEIDTFLLSCRIIGRTVEKAMLGFLAERSRRVGAEFLQGWFFPTKRNAPARDLYSSHRFKAVTSMEDGATLWRLSLKDADIPYPEWIQLYVTNEPCRSEQARV